MDAPTPTTDSGDTATNGLDSAALAATTGFNPVTLAAALGTI
jgi:hypothetical protein